MGTSIPDQDATETAAFSYAFPANTFADADSHALTYTATQSDGSALPTWLSFTANTRTFAGTPPAASAGTMTVRVTADDGNGGTVSDDFVLKVSVGVSVTVWGSSEIPESGSVRFRVALTSPAKERLQVAYTYTSPAGQQTGALIIGKTRQSRIEPFEVDVSRTGRRTHTYSLRPASSGRGNYKVLSPREAQVTVIDDAQPVVNLSVSSATASEASGSREVTLTATRSEANSSGEALSIPIRVKAQGTTAAAADYTLAGTISIADGASSGTATFTVVDDSTDEPAETVVVELGTLPAGTVAGPDTEVTITIADDDDVPLTPNTAPTVSTAIPDQDATVGAAFSYAFAATTFADADSDALSYTATQSDGTALPAWLSFTANTRTFSGTPTAAGTVTVRVTANDGNGGTVTDDFVITVRAAGGVKLGFTRATSEIAEEISESVSNTHTGIRLSKAHSQDIVIPLIYNAGNSDTATAGTDYDKLDPASVTVPAGETFVSVLLLNPLPDRDVENSETLTVTLDWRKAQPSNVVTGIQSGRHETHTTTIYDTPVLSFSGGATSTVSEGDDPHKIRINRSKTKGPLIFRFEVSGTAQVGEAGSGADFDAPRYSNTGNFGRRIHDNTSSFDLTLTIHDDACAEGDKTIRIELVDGIGYVLPDGPAPVHTVTITDDDTTACTPPSPPATAVPDQDTAIPDQDATVGAAFSYAFPANTFVDADSDALAYIATQSDGSVLPTWLSFTAGSRSFAGTPAAGDTGPVTVRVTANDGNGGTVSDDFVITVHPAPALVLAPAEDVSVDEGDTARYTVRLAGKPTGDVTVTIASDDTGAVTVADTDAVADGPQNTLSFTTTTWNTAQSVTVRGVEDDDATDEDVALTHTAAGGNYAGVTGTLAVRVSDDDMRDDLAAAAADAGLVRFGRTVGEQSVSAVRDRLSADRRQGFTGSLAGQALPSMDGTSASVNDGTASSPVNEAVNEAAGPGAEISEDAELAGSGAGSGGPTAVTALRSWLAGPGDAVDAGAGAQVRALDATDIVAGTSFALTRETDGGGTLALWGRGVHSGFSGQQGGIDIDGRVTGFQLGADHARGDWTYGLMVSRSTGDIEYSAAQGGGEIGLDLTALVPYVGWDVTAGLSAWGTLGFGRGDMTLTPETPETPDGGAVLRSDIDWQMAAAGVEGILTPSTRVLGGAALNWHADALWTRTRADALPGRRGAPGGETTRLRFGLESRWQHSLASGGVLTPQLEMALRHDGGDAETGFGLEIGGGLDWSAPERGLSLGLSGRTLALHEDGSFGDWGVSVVLDYDPAPDTKRGFAARLSHDLGGSASGGAQALLGPESFPGLNAASGGGRWALETAYGVSRGRGRVGSSYMALSGADAVAATRLGYRLEPDAPHAEDVSVDVWAEPALQPPTNPRNTNNHRLGMDLNWKW